MITMSNIKVYNYDLPDLNLLAKGDLAIDTEAMGLNYLRDRLCALQICDNKNNIAIIKFNNQFDSPNLKKLLTSKDYTAIFHYARFDLGIIRHYLDVEIPNIFCTKIASKLARTYTDSHGLKDLCRDLLGVNISKLQQSSDWGIETELSKEQIDYASSDVLYLHRLKDILSNMLTREKRLDIAGQCFKALHVRVSLDLMGFKETDIFAHR